MTVLLTHHVHISHDFCCDRIGLKLLITMKKNFISSASALGCILDKLLLNCCNLHCGKKNKKTTKMQKQKYSVKSTVGWFLFMIHRDINVYILCFFSPAAFYWNTSICYCRTFLIHKKSKEQTRLGRNNDWCEDGVSAAFFTLFTSPAGDSSNKHVLRWNSLNVDAGFRKSMKL